MFCNQCEQTAHGTGCNKIGVCGKTDAVANSQDVLIQALRTLASTALKARAKGIVDPEVDKHTARALFATLTNVNFDQDAIDKLIYDTVQHRMNLAAKLGCTVEITPQTITAAIEKLYAIPVCPEMFDTHDDIRSAMQILLYGMKGAAAYMDHAAILGQTDPKLYESLYKGLHAGLDNVERGLEEWLELIMDCGQANLAAMELLEQGNVAAFGKPSPHQVQLGHVKGKCILVSGHDLQDLYNLLKATEGKGINIYTHGEMLPAHGYPKLREFKHLVGHYGTAWQNQHKEFPAFPGPVLFTTNCLQDPKDYADKIFTTGVVGWPNITHCPNGEFAPVIEKALAMPGFTDDAPGKTVTTGFGRATLLEAAPQILDAVKSGALRHIFLVGGCDGARPGRNYYTEFVEKAPEDTLILTLACGKFRFFDKDLGKIGPFPRLIDMGQCNDAYGAIMVAVALAEALQCSVNELPLTLVLSWYEQKAVAILLTLLSLGVKNVRLGPTLPAFISPNILDVLVKKWNIAPISTPDKDLQQMLH